MLKKFFTYGECGTKLFDLWEESVSCTFVPAFDGAFTAANKWAIEGDVILLSPGCSSFDLFDSYEKRGERFKYLVQRLINGS